MVTKRSWRTLERLADVVGVSHKELHEAIAEAADAPLIRRSDRTRKTGATWKYGVGHASGCFVYDPDGTDVVPPDVEAPPGYFGP